MERVIIFDTTLRDGEQTPGVSLSLHEKVEIAKRLEQLGVDVIEAGFPATSNGDFEAVRAVAEAVSCSVCALSRCVPSDIQRALKALEPAKKPRLHVFIATSDIHMQYKLKMSREEVVARAVESIRSAKPYCEDIEFSCEDASRSQPEFLVEIITAAIAAGATTINIPDTVGYAIPEEFGALVEFIIREVPNSHQARFSVHCHDDLGMAVANSIAAIGKGARQVEVAVNGIGERAGNCSLEEVVMAINTRGDYLQVTHGIETRNIYRTSQQVAAFSGVPIGPCKAIVGANAFAHESGIHQHGMLENPMTYEIMRPESVGKVTSDLVLGKHSGRHAFADRLSDMGYQLDDEQIQRAFVAFKELADRKKTITNEDLEAIVSHRATPAPDVYVLDSFQITGGNKTQSMATVTLLFEENPIIGTAIGEGPVDAAYNAICQAVGMRVQLTHYDIQAVTGGEDALGEVTVRIGYEGQSYSGRGLAPDIIEASIRAYVNAINRVKAQPITVQEA